MPAVRKIKTNPQPVAKKAPGEVRAVTEGQVIEPVTSPAHELQKALHQAGYQPEAFQQRPLSNGMLVMTVLAVYAFSMLMFFGSMTA